MARLERAGEDFSSKGTFMEAAGSFKDAVSIAKASGNRSREMTCLCKLALAESSASQQVEALSDFTACRKIAVDLKNIMMEARALVGLGDIASDQGNSDFARQYYGEALNALKTGNNSEAEAYLAFGSLDVQEAKLESAQKNLGAALTMYEASRDLKGQVKSLMELGLLDRTKTDFGAARKNYSDAMQIAKQDNDRLQVANITYCIADLDFVTGNREAARSGFGTTRGMYQEMGNHVGEGNVLRSLGDISGCQLGYIGGIAADRNKRRRFGLPMATLQGTQTAGRIADPCRRFAAAEFVRTWFSPWL
jgi:tetratricopeptide (TPR) repeat protein